jgi:hypothetical protein
MKTYQLLFTNNFPGLVLTQSVVHGFDPIEQPIGQHLVPQTDVTSTSLGTHQEIHAIHVRSAAQNLLQQHFSHETRHAFNANEKCKF